MNLGRPRQPPPTNHVLSGGVPETRPSRPVAPLAPGDPTQVGPYELVGLLGRGGMGSVYLGKSSAGQRVAIKVVRAELATDPRFLRLFDREALLARRVARFSTAEVLDVGSDDGRPYLVTEYVDGPTLWDAVEHDGPLAGSDLDRVAVAVATALTAIHSAGTVHRDLKPSNVMLSKAGPLVIDFGIAHALDGTTGLTRESAGTPAFMAPEQARGQPVGPAADVFAWGGVMVFAATGRTPFGTGPPDALLYRVVHERPDLNGVPAPLRALVAEAMRPDPVERPTTRQLYSRLLASPTAGTPPPGAAPGASAEPAKQARIPGQMYAPPPTLPTTRVPATLTLRGMAGESTPPGRGARWFSVLARPARRRRVVVMLAAALALAALAVPLLFLLADRRSIDADAVSRRLAAQALDVNADQPGLARRLVLAAYATAPTREARNGLLSLFANANQPRATLAGHSADGVYEIAFSHNGTLLATGDGDGDVRLWDAAGRGGVPPLATLTGHTKGVYEIVFSPDDALLATVGNDDIGRLWDTSGRGTVQPLSTLAGIAESIHEVAFSPDGTLIATGGGDGTARLRRATGRGSVPPLAALTGHTDDIYQIAFSPDGALLATGSGDDTARLWDAASRGTTQPLATLTGHTGPLHQVAFSPDGTLIATGSADGTARLWDTASRGTTQPLATLTGHTGPLNQVAFSPDGTLIATGSADGTARLWQATSRGGDDQPLATLAGHTGDVYDIAFSPDGNLLATVGKDGTARLWDTASRGTVQPLATLTGHRGWVSDVAFSPDGTLLATGGSDGTARVWDLNADRRVDGACADPANRLTAAEWAEQVPELPYNPPCD